MPMDFPLVAAGSGYSLLRRFLIVVASLVAEHGLQSVGSGVVAYRPAQLPLGMWGLPGPGTEPVSPALAGRV